MNLVYACVFFQDKYVSMFELMFKSYIKYNTNQKNTHFLVITQERLQGKIRKIMEASQITWDIFIVESKTFFDAAISRVKIFDYPKINNYDKMLYLDTDIIINASLFELFQKPINNKLYALKETPNYEYHGCYFTKESYDRVSSNCFSSGVLYFDKSMKELFREVYCIQQKIIREKLKISECLDQPIFNFVAIKNKCINNLSLQNFVILNPKSHKEAKHINHFCGQVGNYIDKLAKMRQFLRGNP